MRTVRPSGPVPRLPSFQSPWRNVCDSRASASTSAHGSVRNGAITAARRGATSAEARPTFGRCARRTSAGCAPSQASAKSENQQYRVPTGIKSTASTPAPPLRMDRGKVARNACAGRVAMEVRHLGDELLRDVVHEHRPCTRREPPPQPRSMTSGSGAEHARSQARDRRTREDHPDCRIDPVAPKVDVLEHEGSAPSSSRRSRNAPDFPSVGHRFPLTPSAMRDRRRCQRGGRRDVPRRSRHRLESVRTTFRRSLRPRSPDLALRARARRYADTITTPVRARPATSRRSPISRR